MLSAAELAVVKGIEDSPPEQRAAKFEQAAMELPIYKLLVGQAMLRREKAVRAAEQATRMAAQGGANTAPQTTVAQDIYGELQGVSSLPIRGDMYASLDESGPVARGAGGGIVAFDGGGDIYDKARKAGLDWERAAGVKVRPDVEYAPDVIPSVLSGLSGLESAGYMKDVFERQRARDPLSAEGYGATMRDVAGAPVALASDVGRGIAGLAGPVVGAGSALWRGLTGEEGTTPALAPTPQRTTPVRPDEWDPRSAAGIRSVGADRGTGVDRGVAPGAAGPGAAGPRAAPSAAAPTSILDKMRDDTTRILLQELNTPLPKPESREDVARAVDQRAQAALRAANLPEKLGEEQMKRFVDQAKQATTDRDVDLWMAAATGFFGMAAGGSPFALKNIADGLGIGVKQAQAVLKDFRAAEMERQKGMFEIERARRMEVLGREKDKEEAYQKAQERFDKSHERRISTLSVLVGRLGASELAAATKEAGRMQREVGMASVAASREAAIEQRRDAARAQSQARFLDLVEKTAKNLRETSPGRYMDNPTKAFDDALAIAKSISPEFSGFVGAGAGASPPVAGRYNPQTGKIESGK